MVPKLCCTFGSPGELLVHPYVPVTSIPIKTESLRVEAKHKLFFKNSRWFQQSAKRGNHFTRVIGLFRFLLCSILIAFILGSNYPFKFLKSWPVSCMCYSLIIIWFMVFCFVLLVFSKSHLSFYLF